MSMVHKKGKSNARSRNDIHEVSKYNSMMDTSQEASFVQANSSNENIAGTRNSRQMAIIQGLGATNTPYKRQGSNNSISSMNSKLTKYTGYYHTVSTESIIVNHRGFCGNLG